MAELKPCPFCGSNRQFIYCRSGNSYGRIKHFVLIRCEVCGGQAGTTTVGECNGGCKDGEFCEGALEALAVTEIKWNRRTE